MCCENDRSEVYLKKEKIQKKNQIDSLIPKVDNKCEIKAL